MHFTHHSRLSFGTGPKGRAPPIGACQKMRAFAGGSRNEHIAVVLQKPQGQLAITADEGGHS